MKRLALLAAATALLAAPAFAQTLAPPPYLTQRDDLTTGSLRHAPEPPVYANGMNAKNPALPAVPGLPAWQQGSGTETGGPARELIPR